MGLDINNFFETKLFKKQTRFSYSNKLKPAYVLNKHIRQIDKKNIINRIILLKN